MKRFRCALIVMLFALVLCAQQGLAAGNIYGATGLIETPTDLIAGKSELTLSGTYFSDFDKTDESLTIWGGSYGVSEKMEVNWSVIDSDVEGFKSKNIIGAKFNITPESSTATGVSIGVLDTGKKFKEINPELDDASYYVVFGKSLNVSRNPYQKRHDERPVRATFGYGKGIYKGIFSGLNFGLTDKLEAKVEYLQKGIRNKSTVNAALQMNLAPNLSLRVGSLGMKDFFGSVSFSFGGKF